MRISVVIPTYERPLWLLKTASQVLAQRHPAVCELLIIDQTPWDSINPESQVAIKELSKNDIVTYLQQSIPNLPTARNLAISKAKGDIIIFLDDDVLIPNSFIDIHYQCYTRSKDSVMAVAGLPFHRLKDREIGMINLENYRDFCQPHFNKKRIDWQWNQYMVGANFSVLKNKAIEIHGFDENFIGPAAYEDKDFSYRLKNRFPKDNICYSPQAFVVHYKAPSGGCRIRSKNNWSEYEILLSGFIFGWRHLNKKELPSHFWQMLRRGPLRKENIIEPWRQLWVWFIFAYVLIKSYSLKKRTKHTSI